MLPLVLVVQMAADVGTPAIALFDFNAREPDELSVRRGEALQVLKVDDGEEGWAQGRSHDGRQGLLPLSYVRLLPSTAAEASRVEVAPSGNAAVAVEPAAARSKAEAAARGLQHAPTEDPAAAAALWQ